jgi:hypothetical protein
VRLVAFLGNAVGLDRSRRHDHRKQPAEAAGSRPSMKGRPVCGVNVAEAGIQFGPGSYRGCAESGGALLRRLQGCSGLLAVDHRSPRRCLSCGHRGNGVTSGALVGTALSAGVDRSLVADSERVIEGHVAGGSIFITRKGSQGQTLQG